MPFATLHHEVRAARSTQQITTMIPAIIIGFLSARRAIFRRMPVPVAGCAGRAGALTTMADGEVLESCISCCRRAGAEGPPL